MINKMESKLIEEQKVEVERKQNALRTELNAKMDAKSKDFNKEKKDLNDKLSKSD